MKRVLVSGLVALVVGSSSHGQSTIVLKAAARVPAEAPVVLADVASLLGAEAEALAKVVVVPAIERGASRRAGAERVDAERVRAAIDTWTPGPGEGPVNWGRMTLGGGTCVILPPLSGPAPQVQRAPAAEAPETGTVRGVIAARLGMLLNAQRTDLRLAFDQPDREFLDLNAEGRTVDVRPTGMSGRMPLAVTVYETMGAKIVAARTVRVGVQVRRAVVLAAAAKRRGELIGPGDLTTEERWVGPEAALLPLEKVIGTAVKSRLVPGEPVMPQDIQPPIVVGRGDLVSVHCVSGLVVVRTTARALDEARDGETVRLQSLADEHRTFYGRMDGRGRAVAVVADAMSKGQ